jgi:hypothetical protein
MTDSHAHRLPAPTRIAILWSILLSAGWAALLWNFWDRGVFALGVNAAVYLAALASLFLWMARSKGIDLRENLRWVVPIFLIIASYALYDNPFLKSVSLLVLPVLFAGFLNHAFLEEKGRHPWDLRLLLTLVGRVAGFLFGLWHAAALHLQLIENAENRRHETLRRVVLGVVLFLAIASAVIVPLLASADATFGAQTDAILQWFGRFISADTVMKILVAAILSVATVAALVEWCKPFARTLRDDAPAQVDSIVSGIVLGGTLALYLLFLGIQVRHLWIGSLPFDFNDAEAVVKSGFWQLLFLTIINIVIAFLTYRRTTAPVQGILLAFTGASLLLLASAAHRMALYVTTYGFSYEKAFAAYAVLYCAVLLVWLIVRMSSRGRADILHFGIMLFLWMYAALTILPVEQAVFRGNVALAERPGSRIRLYEMTMLSTDVLGIAERYAAEGLLAERQPFTWHGEESGIPAITDGGVGTTHPLWERWFARQKDIVAQKAWYERTLTDLLRR